MSSPYYLHPNENPASQLTTNILTVKNYHSWSRSVRFALTYKNKEEFIDGSIPVPNKDDPLYKAWKRCNTFVLSWIIKSVCPSIAQSIMWIDSVKDLWKDLFDRYAQSDSIRISNLSDEINSLIQKNNSVTEYFTQLKILWDELSNMRPASECQLEHVSRRYYEKNRIIKFLKGLNESFNVVRSQILLIEPLPSLNKVFALVI